MKHHWFNFLFCKVTSDREDWQPGKPQGKPTAGTGGWLMMHLYSVTLLLHLFYCLLSMKVFFFVCLFFLPTLSTLVFCFECFPSGIRLTTHQWECDKHLRDSWTTVWISEQVSITEVVCTHHHLSFVFDFFCFFWRGEVVSGRGQNAANPKTF